MKKLIIISIIFALMLGGAIWEIFYTTNVYSDVYDGLIAVQKSMDEHEDVYNEETLRLTDEVIGIWEKNKEILFCFGNHNVLRMIDEKLESLKAMVNINYTDDAKIMVAVSIGLIEAVQNDTVPNATNLF